MAPTSQSKNQLAHAGALAQTPFVLTLPPPSCGRVLHIHGHRDCAGWLQQHLPLVRGPELPQQHPQQVPHQHGPNAGKKASQPGLMGLEMEAGVGLMRL